MALDRNYYVGTVLSGGFTIKRFVGAGAFAYVYLAISPSGQQCAVKVQYNLVDDARKRFAREIKVLKTLPPNDYLVRYYSDGILPEGYPYLVMEFVDGITLKEALKRDRQWPVNKCCEFMLQLCDAFDGLHQLGIAHRDVKPENIMITNTNHQVKLMDLGLIKDSQGFLKFFESDDIMSNREFGENLDKGVLAGTPEYMAPEQFSDASVEDESKTSTDTWTDVYSLGLIFYEMLTGKKLFVFTPDNKSQKDYALSLLAYLKQRTNQNDAAIQPPPDVPYQLWTIIAKSLHADSRTRQHNASEFGGDIRHFMTTGEGVIESDSDKTSAIDIANFAEVMRATAAKENKPAAPPPVPGQTYGNAQNNIVAHNQNMISPALPPYATDLGASLEDEADDNTWLWIIVIGLLIIVILVLVFIIFVI